MKKRNFWYLLPLTIIIVVVVLIFSEQVPVLARLVENIRLTVDEVRSYIGWFGTALSLFLYIKTKFFDTGMFHKLRKSFGDQRFIIALEKMLLMLEVYDPETVVDKILAISDMQIDMQKALVDLNKIILSVVETEDKFKLNLSKKDKKKLKKEINKLLELVGVKLEVHYMQKDIKHEAESAIVKLQDTLQRSKVKKDIVKHHYKRADKKKKTDLIRLFNRKADS